MGRGVPSGRAVPPSSIRRTKLPACAIVCALFSACAEAEPTEPPKAPAVADAAPLPAEAPAPPSSPTPVEPSEPSAAEAEDPPVVARPAPPEPAALSPPAAETAPGPPGLDLDGLEQRLRETDSLGVLTKLALKNEVDNLIDEVDAFHRKGRGQLPELRERFDLLFMKVMSLLQDDAPDLADEIASSREGLWSLLADPGEFAKLSA